MLAANIDISGGFTTLDASLEWLGIAFVALGVRDVMAGDSSMGDMMAGDSGVAAIMGGDPGMTAFLTTIKAEPLNCNAKLM